ncbi:MAG: hypothetical protein HYS24_12835 [Ignavibacteriales bacterium]|nr:hypothetical protein [Ignavibacteriales bacterium]
MPEYLSLLRELSVNSIYALLILVLIITLFKGRIKNRELILVFYVWLPIAVITQFFMTYFRVHLSRSNLPIMNFYLMIEFILFVVILLLVKKNSFGKKVNFKLWSIIVVIGLVLHLIDKLDTIHSSAMLFIAIIYFQLSINSIELDKSDELIKDPFTILNITIFVKAFGYSYFLIYQTDYTFPLSIYSGVNFLVQILFALTLIMYYKNQPQKKSKAEQDILN